MVVIVPLLLSLSLMVIFFLLIQRLLHFRGLDTVRITKVKGHADEGTVLEGLILEYGNLIEEATLLLMRLLTLVDAGLAVFRLLMLVEIFLVVCVDGGTRLFLPY